MKKGRVCGLFYLIRKMQIKMQIKEHLRVELLYYLMVIKDACRSIRMEREKVL
jgi:hypothetical protein